MHKAARQPDAEFVIHIDMHFTTCCLFSVLDMWLVESALEDGVSPCISKQDLVLKKTEECPGYYIHKQVRIELWGKLQHVCLSTLETLHPGNGSLWRDFL